MILPLLHGPIYHTAAEPASYGKIFHFILQKVSLYYDKKRKFQMDDPSTATWTKLSDRNFPSYSFTYDFHGQLNWSNTMGVSKETKTIW